MSFVLQKKMTALQVSEEEHKAYSYEDFEILTTVGKVPSR